MSISPEPRPEKVPNTPWGLLPPRLRVLFITGPRRVGRWLAEAFAGDSAAEVLLEEALGIAAGATRLRTEVFDAVLVSHEPGQLDALQVVDALRAGSSDEQPILVLGDESEAQMTALCFEAGADGYIWLPSTTTRALIWQIARARERHHLIAENRRLRHEQRHRLQLEHDEAGRLLQQQHAMISDLEKVRHAAQKDAAQDLVVALRDAQRPAIDMTEPLVARYRELLRTYVIMGSGNLADELRQLALLISQSNLTAQQVMQLHLNALEEAVQGLGSRSARHVINRADLLILEVMLNLAEIHRQRSLEHHDTKHHDSNAKREAALAQLRRGVKSA